MIQAGCSYDNAPMERFYSTLKNEYFNLRKFKGIESLNTGIYRFVYCHYNRTRLYSHNGGQTPWLFDWQLKFYHLMLQFYLTTTQYQTGQEIHRKD